MPLPPFDADGLLPPSLHAAPLRDVLTRFGSGSPARERQAELLRLVAEAAARYEEIKRVLVWGSFVTDKRSPNDLDYSVVVSFAYDSAAVAATHRRFLIPVEARMFYGVDRNYLVLPDYPYEDYIDSLDFITLTRKGRRCGVVEISLRGERGEGGTE